MVGTPARWASPEEFHPALTKLRLEIVASVLRWVQDQAALEFSEVKGDTPWNHGCTAFERCRIIMKRLKEKLEWFDTLDETRHFVFLIGGYPVRFSKAYGEEEKPSRNVILRGDEEIEQAKQSFIPGTESLAKFSARFLISRDATTHRVKQVTFVVMDEEGKKVRSWKIKSDLPVEHLLTAQSAVEDMKVDVADPEYGIEKGRDAEKEKG